MRSWDAVSLWALLLSVSTNKVEAAAKIVRPGFYSSIGGEREVKNSYLLWRCTRHYGKWQQGF
jgi:hypothetical protein